MSRTLLLRIGVGLTLVTAIAAVLFVATRGPAYRGPRFEPTLIPAGFALAESSTSDYGEGNVAYNVQFERNMTGEDREFLVVSTIVFTDDVDLMQGRHTAPDSRPITIRGHQAVLERLESEATNTPRDEHANADDGGDHSPEHGGNAAPLIHTVVTLTWIERDGVGVQLIGENIEEETIVKIASSLREIDNESG